MKTISSKAFFAVASTGILCAVFLIASPSNAEPIKVGQDKEGKNCERTDTKESSTFGKCEKVCKDKPLTRDALNDRWVCKASAITFPNVHRSIERLPNRNGGVPLQN